MTTFVTAFINLHEERPQHKSQEMYLEMFQKLVDTGIQIHVFASRDYIDRIPDIKSIRKTTIELDELDTYKDLEGLTYELPDNRTLNKDTRNFMILMNTKTEFIRRSIEVNPFNTEQYAWIDFGIFHVFRDIERSKKFLGVLGSTLIKPGIYVPGCWGSGYPSFSQVCWRFCGGFFIGDRDSLLEFDSYHQRLFPQLLEKEGVLTWEVNMWAAYEANGWKPNWYIADHNDSLIVPPRSCFKVVASLTTIPPRIETECRLTIDSLLPQVDQV